MNNRSNWVTLFFYLFNVKYKFVFCKFQLVEWKNILLSNKKHKIHKKNFKKNTSLNDGFSHFKFPYLDKHLSNKGMTLFIFISFLSDSFNSNDKQHVLHLI